MVISWPLELVRPITFYCSRNDELISAMRSCWLMVLGSVIFFVFYL